MQRYGLFLCSAIVAALAVGCPEGGGATTLTQQQQDAIAKMVETATSIAEAALATVPAFEQAGSDEGACPDVTISISEDLRAVVTLDYGQGCDPAGALDGVASGVMSVTLGSDDSLVWAFEDFHVDGHSIDGTLTGFFVRSDAGFDFDVTVDVVTELGEVDGTLNISVGATGVIDLRSAMLTISGDQDVQIQLDDLVMDPASNGNFVPEAGLAIVTLAETDIAVEFTADSPSTGIVLVSVNGAAQIEVSLP